MRDFRIHLEKLQKSLVRKGYEVPNIEDYSEDGLFRFAKFLEGVLMFTHYDDFWGEMHKRFYEEFVRERDEALRNSKESKNVQEAGYSEDNPFLQMLNASSQVESDYVEDESTNNWEEDSNEWLSDEEAPVNNWGTEEEEFSNDWEDVEEEYEPSNNWEDESEDEFINNWDDSTMEDEFSNNWEDGSEENFHEVGIWADEDDPDAPNNLEDIFDIDDELINEVSQSLEVVTEETKEETKVIPAESTKKGLEQVKEKPKTEVSDVVRKNNKTIDMLGTWLGGTKKKRRPKND